MRRIFLILVGFASLLAACQETPPTATNTPIVIETQDSVSSSEFRVWGLSGLGVEINDYMVEVFRERHPEIEVIITDEGWDEALRLNLENAIRINQPPDVAIGENYFRSFASQGQLQNLDEIIAASDLIPATYEAGIYQGQAHAVPLFTGVFGLERNCSVIEAAGRDCDQPPQYWDEFLEEVRAINEAGQGQYYGYTLQGPGGTAVGAAFRIAVYQAQIDRLPCADDACTVPLFNHPDDAAAMTFIRELSQYTPPGLLQNTHEGEVYEALFRGVSAYQIAGSWHVSWAQEAGCLNCRYSPIPYAREGHPANLLVGNVLFAAPKNSHHPDLAREWIELMISEEVQDLIFPLLGRLPVSRVSLEKLRLDVDEATAVFIDELLNTESLHILPQWENMPRETWVIYNQMLDAVLNTQRSIPEIMDEAQQAIERLHR